MASMRINQYLAQVLGISRRTADKEIASGKVTLRGVKATLGDQVAEGDKVEFKGKPVVQKTVALTTVMLNKPVGYVTSRLHDETEAPTVMDLLPPELQHLKPVGRLDKESGGLLLLTDDGDLLYRSTHPKFRTEKVYLVEFDSPLSEREVLQWKRGLKLTDGIARADDIVREGRHYRVTLHQGKNRQIRRMAGLSGNKVNVLTRVKMGDAELGDLKEGKWKVFTQKTMTVKPPRSTPKKRP